MGKLRLESYQEFAKRIEFPVIAYHADTGEIIIMNYEAKLILGQKTTHVKVKLNQESDTEDFFTRLHDRRSMISHQMILSNDQREYAIEGIVNEFDVDDQNYYMILFDMRSLNGDGNHMLERMVDESKVVFSHVTFRNGYEMKVDYMSHGIHQFGYTPVEFYQGRIRFRDIIHPDDLQFVLDAWADSAENKKETDSLEYRIVTESRKVRTVSSSVRFAFDDYGNTVGMDLVMYEITSEKEERKEIRYLRDALEQSRSVAIDLRLTGEESELQYISANAVQFGIDVEDVRVGRKRLEDYVYVDDQERMKDLIRNAGNSDAVDYSYQCRILGEDGILRWVTFYLHVKHIEEGVLDLELLLHDITTEKQREEKLIRNQKELEDRLLYVKTAQVETSKWTFDDVIPKVDVDKYLQVYAENNQIYAAGVNPEGELITKPAGPMFRLGEFYSILERSENIRRIKEALSKIDEEHKYCLLNLAEGSQDQLMAIVPVVLDGRVMAGAIIAGLGEEMVIRVRNSAESFEEFTSLLSRARFDNRRLKADARKSRLAEESMRKELEGQMILSQAFAHMRNDANVTLQEIIEKSCELLHLSAMAIYFNEPEQETYTCLAKHITNPNPNWDFEDQSWRVTELCKTNVEVKQGRYVMSGAEEEYESILIGMMSAIQAHSIMVYGVRMHHEIRGAVVFATDEERSFSEQEIAYGKDVAHIVQGILYRNESRSNMSVVTNELLNSYNYMKECVFIKDVHSGKVLFANDAMENLFEVDVTGMDSREFLSEPVPTYTREGVLPAGNFKWQSYIKRINKIMNIQELSIEWINGKDARIVIMREEEHPTAVHPCP
ncbi:MAG: PAS domain-containing protein [Lachnospiraceae bacterium]|nr:PAS domain-containing protein [Lachnospiraceae bacterium]